MKIDWQAVRAKFIKIEVAVKAVLAVAIGGGAAALSAHFTDPTAFAFTHSDLVKMLKIAGGGAAIALFHLYMSPGTGIKTN